MRKVLLCVVLVSLTIGCNSEEKRRQEEKAAAKAAKAAAKEERERQRAVSVDQVRGALASLNASAKPEDILNACEPALLVNALKLDSAVASRCAEGYASLAKKAVKRRELADAEMHLKNLKSTGITNEEISKLQDEYEALATAAREKEERRLAREQFVAGAGARKDYANELRTHFLDQSMDIKVSVSGRHNERLKLTFVLFNDVWMHNFKKGSLIDEIRGKGFKRVDLSDGYDWGYYFTFSE